MLHDVTVDGYNLANNNRPVLETTWSEGERVVDGRGRRKRRRRSRNRGAQTIASTTMDVYYVHFFISDNIHAFKFTSKARDSELVLRYRVCFPFKFRDMSPQVLRCSVLT